MKNALALVVVTPIFAFAADNCELTRPPRDAAVNVNHGSFFFIYPRAVGDAYTGCQTMWDEKNNKIWHVEFDAGKPRAMTISEPAKPAKTIRCSYRDGALTEGPKDECVEPDSLKMGIPSISKKDEPPVPKGRDPRR